MLNGQAMGKSEGAGDSICIDDMECWLSHCHAYDLIPSVIAVCDATTKLRYANPAFRKLDQTLRESSGDSQWIIPSLLASDGMAKGLRDCLTVGKARTYAGRFYYSHAISIELSWLMRPLLNGSGAVEGVLLTLGEESVEFGRRHLARMQDSVEKLSARILQLSEEKLQTNMLLRILHRDAPTPLLILNTDQQVIQANRQAEVMFGRWGRELIGMSCQQLLGGAGNCSLGQAKLSVIPERLTIHRPDGSCIIAERTIARTEGVHGDFLIEAFNDITQREHAEADLKAALGDLAEERELLARRVDERTHELIQSNAELKRAAQAKDEFLAAMSHELRTPLTAILGMTEMLTEGYLGRIPDAQQEYLSIIHKSGSHLLELINDILDIAKAESGAFKLALDDEVNLADVCEASLRLIGPQAKKKHITPEFRMDSKNVMIRADKRRLKQVLVNLLGNAVKFTPDGGRLGLDVAADAASERVCLTVWDSGIGISENDQAKLFKPFFQVDSKLSRQYEGTGLGLAMVARMVTLHGGEVLLQSTPGKGSRFQVNLPWGQNIQRSVERTSVTANEIEKQTDATTLEATQQAMKELLSPDVTCKRDNIILLVEDEPVNQLILEDFLASQGYQVSCASNGAEGLSKAQKLLPNLILMDVQMPVMDGLEATRRLKSDPILGNIPVIMLTALAMSGDKEICLAAGADGYLSKPIELKKLAETVAGYIKRTD